MFKITFNASLSGADGTYKDIFQLFNSVKYGLRNLMFTDTTKEFYDVLDKNTYFSWVGE
jgi:hypothetical protein